MARSDKLHSPLLASRWCRWKLSLSANYSRGGAGFWSTQLKVQQYRWVALAHTNQRLVRMSRSISRRGGGILCVRPELTHLACLGHCRGFASDLLSHLEHELDPSSTRQISFTLYIFPPCMRPLKQAVGWTGGASREKPIETMGGTGRDWSLIPDENILTDHVFLMMCAVYLHSYHVIT